MGLTNGSHGFQPFSPFGTLLFTGGGAAQPPFYLGIQGNAGIPVFDREPEKDLHFSRWDFGRDLKGKPVICWDFYCLFYGHGFMIPQNPAEGKLGCGYNLVTVTPVLVGNRILCSYRKKC
jgi:hypothetical protein